MAEPRTQLAARRKALGYSQEALAHELGVTVRTYFRWEKGATPSPKQRRPLAAILEVSLAELDMMLAEGGGHGYVAGFQFGSAAVPGWLRHYASLEQAAARKKRFEPIMVPGLLQTARYAEAVMRDHRVPSTEEEIQARLATRLDRQAVLGREPDPLELHYIIDESALRRVAGGPDIMAEQLTHLVQLAQRPTIVIQVLPLGSGALHNAAYGPFDLFIPTGSDTPYMSVCEGLTGFTYNDDRRSIADYSTLFEFFAERALTPSESGDLLIDLARSGYR